MPTGRAHPGAPSTSAWRTLINDEKNVEKTNLAQAHPGWKPNKLENEAKKAVELNMAWYG